MLPVFSLPFCEPHSTDGVSSKKIATTNSNNPTTPIADGTHTGTGVFRLSRISIQKERRRTGGNGGAFIEIEPSRIAPPKSSSDFCVSCKFYISAHILRSREDGPESVETTPYQWNGVAFPVLDYISFLMNLLSTMDFRTGEVSEFNR